jgi:sulfur-carrier protein adenylyltransferase/sulfurtransferase
MPLSAADLLRYSRHLTLTGFGAPAQEKLKQASVLVVGAGGLGCPALLYLAAAGVGRIAIIDPDVVDVSNLQRQVLFTTADLGQPKALVAAARLHALNPLITIEPHVGRLDSANALTLIRSVDVVLDGSDNFPTRYLINDACVLTGRPFIYGAIQAFDGQLSVFNWLGGATYRDLFPTPPAPGSIQNCAQAGVLGVLPGLIGTAQACEALKLLTGLGEPLSGRLLLWDALTMTTRTLRITADPTRTALTALTATDYAETCSPSTTTSPDELRCADLPADLNCIQLLDVRELNERALGAIQPSFHIPLSQLDTPGALAVLDPTAPTVIYCASGLRSLRALEILRTRHGFTSAHSLQGGYTTWLTQTA